MSLVIPTFMGVLGFIIVGYLLSRWLKRNDVADVLWGLGFITIGIIHSLLVPTLSFRALLILILTIIWGLRLAIHIGFRTLGKKEEDIRYSQWRKDWGAKEPLMAFVKIFLLQGLIMGVISLPIVWGVHSTDSPITAWDFLGVSLFIIGFLIETFADLELASFKRNSENRGQVMNKGLWSLSRHPNYFGEVLIWWGLFFISQSIVTLASPLLITFLLTRVSGVPMLEKVLVNRGPDFKTYILTTPSFLPFRRGGVYVFFTIAITLMALDFLWLGVFMGPFYRRESLLVARSSTDGKWDIILWASLGVYFFLALGIQCWAISSNKLKSGFNGALLGLCIYSIYDLTNVALLKNWSEKMALLDLAWGPILCGIAAIVGFWVKDRDSRQKV